jgi:hypothetical protein
VGRGAKRGVVLAALGLSVTGAAGCTTDPTENNFYVRVNNNTHMAVTLYDCGGSHCAKRTHPQRLRPGAISGPEFASAGVSNPVAVVAADGRLLGCLPLEFRDVAPGRRVRVSTASTC